MMLFQLTLLYTTTQPHPSASEGEAECIGDIPPSPPISPGSGLNWEICGWDSEGRCGGGGGESCFLKFYLPSSAGISAVLCPAFSFVLQGQGHDMFTHFCGCLFCICFLLEVFASTGQEGSAKEALRRRPHWGLVLPRKIQGYFCNISPDMFQLDDGIGM